MRHLEKRTDIVYINKHPLLNQCYLQTRGYCSLFMLFACLIIQFNSIRFIQFFVNETWVMNTISRSVNIQNEKANLKVDYL